MTSLVRRAAVVAAAACLVLLSGCSALAPDTPGPTPASIAPTVSGTSTAAPTPSATPATSRVLAPGDTGDQVRELQHRLRQLEWFTGEITGNYLQITTEAVRDFQAERGLDVTGDVDQRTWTTLVGATRTPTRAQLANAEQPGPALLEQGARGPEVRDVQARLKQLNWYAKAVDGAYGTFTTGAVRGFQGKRGLPATGDVDQRTLDRLAGMTHDPTDAELADSVSTAALDPRCSTGRVMCVSKRTRTLTWMIDGQPRLRLDVRFGRPGMRTREGVFAVSRKSRDHVSAEFGGSMPYAMFFSGGQAVHYSADFARRGYAGASHGCVNVRNLAAIRDLFDQVRVGDAVVVHR